jgi:hypothetical protein
LKYYDEHTPSLESGVGGLMRDFPQRKATLKHLIDVMRLMVDHVLNLKVDVVDLLNSPEKSGQRTAIGHFSLVIFYWSFAKSLSAGSASLRSHRRTSP